MTRKKMELNNEETKYTKFVKRFERDTIGDPWTNLVIGAAIEVHRILGPGFLESVYEAALCIELQQRGIPFVRQAPVAVQYKGCSVGEGVIDVLVGGTLVVELKTIDAFAPIHVAQVMSYLQALDQRVGLLLNFKVPILGQGGLKRIIRP
jgi:GxxExxY protein